LHHLHRLATGQRAEGVDVVLLVQLLPQPLGAEPRQRVLLADSAGQAHHVLGGVGALHVRPARVRGPAGGQRLGTLLLLSANLLGHVCSLALHSSRLRRLRCGRAGHVVLRIRP
jgi:hypothetical protein